MITNDNKRIKVLTASDDAYSQHLGVMLLSMYMNQQKDTKIDVYLINCGISFTNMNKIRDVATNHRSTIFEIIPPTDRCHWPVPQLKHVTSPTYMRLLVSEILPKDLHRILYLDCDIIVQSDIRDLWQIDMTGNTVAAVTDHHAEKKDNEYFNAGVLLIDIDMWRKNAIQGKVLNLVMKNRNNKCFMADQDALNIAAKGTLALLPWFYNYQIHLISSFRRNVDYQSAIIIHYTGAIKPWHLRNARGPVAIYYKYLEKSPWKQFQPRRSRVFKNITLRIKYQLKRLINNTRS